MALDVDKTPFTSKVLGIFDSDGSGQIDFVEFVLAMWNFCSLNDADICCFAFRCFAKKRDGKWYLDPVDCDTLLDAIYGPNRAGKERRMTQQYLDRNCRRSGSLTMDLWLDWTRRNARAVFPIFEIQRRMRRKCLGTRFWKKQQRRRKRIFGTQSWEEIEQRLEAAAMVRKRRVIEFEPRDPLPFDDADLEITPRDDEGEPRPAPRRLCMPSFDHDDNDDSPAVRIRSNPVLLPSRKAPRSNAKYRVVNVHGFDQTVATPESASKTPPQLVPPGPTDPVCVKAKPFVRAKRTRAEAIAVLQTLRKGPRGCLARPTAPELQASTRLTEAVANSLPAARYISRAIELHKPQDRLKPTPSCVLSEPSDLEKSYGIRHLGHFVPAGSDEP